MKVVAVLLAVVAASMADICADVDNGRAEATKIKDIAATAMDTLMGDCYPNDDAFSALLNSEACSALFYQGTCYGLKTAAKYADVEVVSYDMLRRGVSDVQNLGNLACANVEACYNEVYDAVYACAAQDGYLDGVIERATQMYKEQAEQRIREYGEQNDNTILGRLINVAMNRFQNVDSIRAFVSQNVDDAVIADAFAGWEAAKAAASEFCESGCVDSTAVFLKKMFSSMNRGQCVDASVFCGACERNAASFLRRKSNAIPCCLQDVIEQAIEGATYVADVYGDRAADMEAYLREVFADQPELIAKAEAGAAAARAEIDCVSSVYDGASSSCA